MAEEAQKTQPVTKECSDQLIYFLQDATDNIRLAKRQQWNVGYYTILLYAAIVLSAERVAPALPALMSYKLALAVVAALLAAGTAAGGVAVIWNLQGWMAKHRGQIIKAEAHFCDEYKELLDERGARYMTKSYASAIPWLLSIILTVSAAVAVGLVIVAVLAGCQAR